MRWMVGGGRWMMNEMESEDIRFVQRLYRPAAKKYNKPQLVALTRDTKPITPTSPRTNDQTVRCHSTSST